MQIYKLNRTVEGLKTGTMVIREDDLPLDYTGSMTVLVLNEKAMFT